ncbi:MAG: tRNA-dihydrouridine synthase [bacterium]|nr:tRNA-dihydrouridine synthase [bacterium]
MSFWDELQRPFFVLAPLADVTDPAFRRIIAKYSKWGSENVIDQQGKFTRPHAKPVGGPEVMYTEFVSADGLMFAPEAGRKKLLADLQFSEIERPIIAQFFTGKPEVMEKAAALAANLGFDGVDINMGCPDASIEKQKAGAALMKDSKSAKEIIASAVRGAGGLPVSVKTRIGYNKDELDSWLPNLLETDLAAIAIHARTRKEMSGVPAHWDAVSRAVVLRDKLNPNVLIIGNGDAKDLLDARMRAKETGADSVMLGRAIFGNPWLFSQKLFSNSHELENREVPISRRLHVMVEHTKLFEELLPHKNFAIMKKHYKAYVSGFPGAAELRAELMEAEDAKAVADAVHRFLARTPISV